MLQGQYMAQASSYVTKADGLIDNLKGKMGGKFDGILNTADGFIDTAAGFLGVEVTPATGTTVATPTDASAAATAAGATGSDPAAASGTVPPH